MQSIHPRSPNVLEKLSYVLGSREREKLFFPTNLGAAVFGELADARGDHLSAPLVRGSHVRNDHHWVVKNFGRNAGDELMVDIGLDPARLDADGWYPLRAALDGLELVESRSGDGTYEAVRRMLREEAGNNSRP